jgi:hypothetical protein
LGGVSWGSFVEAFRPDILLDRSEDPLGHVKRLPPDEQTRRTERLARASAARQNASEGSDCTPARLTAATHHVSVLYGTTAWPARAHSHRRPIAECGSHPGEDGRACSGRRPHMQQHAGGSRGEGAGWRAALPYLHNQRPGFLLCLSADSIGCHLS